MKNNNGSEFFFNSIIKGAAFKNIVNTEGKDIGELCNIQKHLVKDEQQTTCLTFRACDSIAETQHLSMMTAVYALLQITLLSRSGS